MNTFRHRYLKFERSGLLALAALVIACIVPKASADDYFLQALGDPDPFDAVPVATLTDWAPFAPFLLNYDPLRNAAPGLTIRRGGVDFSERDAEKHQTWVLPGGALSLDGPAGVTAYVAMKDFDTSKQGRMR